MASLLQCHQQTVQRLLSEAITVLCQNSLPFRDHLCVQGLLGITLDNRDVLLVDIHERVARSGGFDSWENQNHAHQDERHEVSDRYAAPPTKVQEDGVLNRNMYNHHVARMQQQHNQQHPQHHNQDPPSIAILSKMYERQMSAFKMDPYTSSNKHRAGSPPRLTSSPRERGTHNDRMSHERPAHKLEAERERLASSLSCHNLEPPTLEAEERGAGVERRSLDNNAHPHKEGPTESEEGRTKQSEGHHMLNGHSSPRSSTDCSSPAHPGKQESAGSPNPDGAVNLSSSHQADDAMISNGNSTTAPGSSKQSPTDGSTTSSSMDSCPNKNDSNVNSDRDPSDENQGSSNVPSQNPISPTSNIVDHRSPTPSGGEQQNQSSPSGDQQNRDSISLTVSKIFSHRFEGQPPLKKRLTEIAEQQNAEEREKERNSENDEDGDAVNYTVVSEIRNILLFSCLHIR